MVLDKEFQTLYTKHIAIPANSTRINYADFHYDTADLYVTILKK